MGDSDYFKLVIFQKQKTQKGLGLLGSCPKEFRGRSPRRGGAGPQHPCELGMAQAGSSDPSALREVITGKACLP